MAETGKDQTVKAQQIQELLLEEFKRQLTPDKNGLPPATAKTIATITQWLEQGGWTVVNPRVRVFPGEDMEDAK